MSSTDPQEAIPSKDEIKTTPTSSKTEEKNLESTTGNSSKSDGLDAANASGDQQAPGNKVLPLIDSTEVNPPDDTDDNSTELLKDPVESSISADDSKKCLEDEETLLKSDDESGDQATESGSLNSKIDVQISSISKFCANQPNSQDLDSLSSELQDEEMILKWDDSDEVEEPNMEQETAILNEEIDVEKITSTTVLQEPEATKAIDNVLVTDTVNEVTTTEVEGVTTDNNIVPKNQDDIIENMDIDTNMTVDNLIANLDKIIDEDVSDTTNVMEVDSTENLKTDLVEPNVSSSIIESKIDLESTRKEMEVDSTGIDTTTNVIKEIETVGTELTEETDIEMEVDTSANVEDSTKENLSHSEPNLLKVLPDIIIQKDLDISNMEIIENLPQVDMKVDEREPKTVENDNRNEPSDSLSLPVPEIKENIADCINEDAEKKTMGTDLNVSSGNDSLDLSVIEAREHGLNEPNMMIEIPTQEFIDFDESPDISQTDSDPGKDKKMLNEDIVETTVNINKDVTEMEESKSSDILLSDETGKENTENIVKESENKGTIIKGENVTKTIEIISDSKEVLPCKDSSTVPIKDVPISISSTAKDTQEAEVSSTEDAEKPSEIALLAKVDQHSVEKVEQPSQEVETLSKEVTILSEEVTPSKDLQHALPSELLVEQPEVESSTELQTLSNEVKILPKEVEPSKDVEQHDSKLVLPVEQPEAESSKEVELSKNTELIDKEVAQTPKEVVEQQASHLELPVEQPEVESSKTVEPSKNTLVIDKEVAQTPKEAEKSVPSQLELPVKQLEIESSKEVEPSKNAELIDKEVAQTPKEVEKSVSSPLELPVKQLEIESSKEVEPSKNTELIDKEVAQTPKEAEKSVPSQLELPVKQLEVESSKEVEPSNNAELIDKEVAQTPKEAEKSVPSQLELPVKQQEVESSKELKPSKNTELIDNEVAQTPKEAEKAVDTKLTESEILATTAPVSEVVEKSSEEAEPIKEVLSKEIDSVPENSSNEEDPSLIETATEPSTSFMTELVKQQSKDQTKDLGAHPSTSFMSQIPDTSDEVPDVTDSLGLLAESSRVMDDDEEQDNSDHDDGDYDEDFDPDDESSNQITAENSEDSNAPHSETDLPKEHTLEGRKEKDVESPNEGEFNFAISEVTSAVKCIEDKDIDLAEEVDITSDTNGEDEQMDQTEESMDVDISSAIEIEEKELKDDELEDDQADMDTVKLSDTTNNEDGDKIHGQSILKDMLCKKVEDQTKDEKLPESPSKTKKLEISKPKHVVNIVDLEESSSEDDIQEVEKDAEPEVTEDVTSVNISGQIEIMSSGGNTSDIVTKEGEIVISGVPKPKIPHKPARLNTSEVTIKTANKDSTLVIPEHQVNDQTTEKSKPKFSLEVFSLDSDEEDSIPAMELKPPEPVKLNNRCINIQCRSDSYVQFYKADPSMVAYYDGNKKKRPMVCQPCAEIVYLRGQDLLQGVKNFTPLLDLAMGKTCQELVEISDSDDEDDGESKGDVKETIGLSAALLMEEKLANMLNETWIKYNMDARLKETEDELNSEIKRLEDESKEINDMLNECQLSTDKLRNDLYATFQQEQQELSSIVIFDTPDNVYSCVEGITEPNESRILKRRLSSVTEIPPKRPAIPLGYAPLDSDSAQGQTPTQETIVPTPAVDPKLDDDKDISVVQLSAEAAPPGLPPPGEVRRPPLQAGAIVFAARNAASSWVRAKLLDYTHKDSAPNTPFSMCRVKFEMKNQKSSTKMVPARYVAYLDPCDVRLTIGTRIIALFKDTDTNSLKKRTSYYSGVVAEIPNPVNSYRYLVFFDDGYAQYVRHADVRLVCECSSLVWEEVQPFSREFVRQYLLAYPERPMVRLHTGQSLKTEWNGKWWISKVIQVDASLVHVHFEEDNRTEWIYRGSTRLAPLYLELQAAERHRARPLPRNRAQRTNMPYVEYTRSDEQAQKTPPEPLGTPAQQEEIRRQRSVAKKSTASTPVPQPHHPAHPPPAPPAPHPHPPASVEPVTSRVVYYTPKNAVKPYKMAAHTCSPKCKRSDVLALADLRTYNPLAKPLLSGWERQIVRYKGHKEVMYRAPCGRRLRNMRELHRYLRATRADMGVDLFDFGPNTHCLAEFVLNKCLVGKKDLSNGKENVPVPCVNYYDDTLPEFCSYNTERTPTAGVPLNLDPDFLCGCDCTDDCEDKSKCACWKMTLEGARTIGLKGNNVGYSYKRLPEPLPSGIYECNSRCKCKHTCLNRVAQHPLQLKLQVFKTPNRGWGIRALNDVPKGSFLCVYAGNLLTDATANLDGLNEGDEYLAELDYIEVVEQMKEGYEDDIPQADKKLDKKDGAKQATDDEEEEESSADEEAPSKNEKEDGDFEPGFLGGGFIAFRKQLRKRDRVTNEKEEAAKKEAPKEGGDDDCITISDDEEVREPSRFMAQAGMSANHFVSKYSSVRTLYGKDEACYIMDAKVQGNIGRYLNHSCCPNVFVQNVFVDTHDPRFPWVSFFAASHIRAGTELTWNYNYDIGSVPGKVLYCYCGATNCRGRLL